MVIQVLFTKHQIQISLFQIMNIIFGGVWLLQLVVWYNLLSHCNYSFNKVVLSGRKILTNKDFWDNIKTDFHNIIQKDIISGAYYVFFIFTKIEKLLLLDSAHSMLKADQKKGEMEYVTRWWCDFYWSWNILSIETIMLNDAEDMWKKNWVIFDIESSLKLSSPLLYPILPVL